MIEVRRTTSASAEAVWKILADGWTYPAWVVGASRMRRVGADWPAVGAELHHSLGVWPLLIDDVTRVLAARPERELRLRGKGWPAGEVEIHLLLRPHENGGCEILMREGHTLWMGSAASSSVNARWVSTTCTAASASMNATRSVG